MPYNRITNLDIKQGPVMRLLRISTLSIQTAGYPEQVVPEIRIEAIEHAEEFRDLIRTMVRQCNTVGDGTGGAAQGIRLPWQHPPTSRSSKNSKRSDWSRN